MAGIRKLKMLSGGYLEGLYIETSRLVEQLRKRRDEVEGEEVGETILKKSINARMNMYRKIVRYDEIIMELLAENKSVEPQDMSAEQDRLFADVMFLNYKVGKMYEVFLKHYGIVDDDDEE